MRGRQYDRSQRPKLKAYLWLAMILIAACMGFLLFFIYITPVENLKPKELGVFMRWGIVSVLSGLVFAYGVHWFAKQVAYEKEQLSVYKTKVVADSTEQCALRERTYSLEIRGVGLAGKGWYQSSVWREIEKKADNFTSIYSHNPEDYKASVTSRTNTSRLAVRAAFTFSATDSVAYWPSPVFALGPPDPYEKGYKAGGLINSGRNAATLGVTQFLWQDDENTSHAQAMIERLFVFFDENPQVPQALIASRDGDVTRDIYRKPDTPGLQNVQVVPTVHESVTGLLVSRSDRVDRYVRPYATQDTEDNQNKKTDLGKLWAFYWDRDRAFHEWYKDVERAKGKTGYIHPPSTMSTAYWQSQLPTLWKTLSNRGPGHFEPSPWLPVRWANHQVKEFDKAPILGYLHRPIKVPMQDENGKLLKPALQAKALQAGWQQALATLPEGEKPVRVFYDSTDNTHGEIALTLALHSLNTDGTGLEIGNVEEGYDIGRRLGNTGVSSALVEINLATIASYKDGGVSAVVYTGDDGSVTVQMVRPPDEARKLKNQQTHGVDPFTFRMPGRTP